MKILVETCLDDLYLLLIKDNKAIDKIHEKNFQKKSDALASKFISLLKNNQLSINDIDSFYVTSGPGSFMGIRAGLIFVATICALKKIKLFICSSLKFIQKNDDVVSWDAKGNLSYVLEDGRITLQSKAQNYNFSYEDVENNLDKYLTKFKEENPLNVKPQYIKEPKIG